MSPLARFRSLYGSSPLHVIAIAATVAISGFAIVKASAYPDRWKILLWFLAAVALHDLVLFPVYTLLDRLAAGRRAPAAAGVNFVRVPAVLSALMLLVSLGLVLGAAPGTYQSATGLRPTPYLERWLAITAVLFVASGILYALRARRSPDHRAPRT